MQVPRIATYKILSQIGAGGMGEVFLAHDEALGRRVALKVIARDEFDQSIRDSAVERFLNEGRALAKLHHPNVVTVYALGEDQGRLYLAMEHVEGFSFEYWIQERRLSIEDIMRVTIEVLKGLGYSHRQGLLHRDLKPANVIIDREGRARLIDFGIAKPTLPAIASDNYLELTPAGVVMGTLNYLAPETLKGGSFSIRSDLYTVGLMLYQAVTGQVPFDGKDQRETLALIRAGRLWFPDNLYRILPHGFPNLVRELTHPDPAKRPASVEEVFKKIAHWGLGPNQLKSFYRGSFIDPFSINDRAVLDELHKTRIDPSLFPFIMHLSRRMRGPVDAKIEKCEEVLKEIILKRSEPEGEWLGPLLGIISAMACVGVVGYFGLRTGENGERSAPRISSQIFQGPQKSAAGHDRGPAGVENAGNAKVVNQKRTTPDSTPTKPTSPSRAGSSDH